MLKPIRFFSAFSLISSRRWFRQASTTVPQIVIKTMAEQRTLMSEKSLKNNILKFPSYDRIQDIVTYEWA
jgi:hypothetical protein